MIPIKQYAPHLMIQNLIPAGYVAQRQMLPFSRRCGGARDRFGPSAAGFAFDLSHSYVVPILVSAAANLVAVIIVATISDRGRRKTVA